MANPLFDIASGLLNASALALSNGGRTPPTRQFVSDSSPPVLDCETLVVDVARVFTGFVGLEDLAPAKCSVSHAAQMRVSIGRCVPTVTDQGEPSPSEITDSAEELMQDAWLLRVGIIAAMRTADIKALCDAWALGPLLPLETSGGIGGWTQEIQVQVQV